MEFSNESFLQGSLELKGNRVLKKGNIIGVLKPPTLFGCSINVSDEYYVYGTDDVIRFKDNIPDNFWEGIVKSNSILFGDEYSVNQVSRILEEPLTSRTYSYLSLLAKDCKELLDMKKKISNAEIVFIGCGGIGSITSLTLAGVGVKKIKLVDFDTIEESNLNRQLFFTIEDIGKYKVDVLKQRIKERFPHIEVEVVKENCITEAVIKNCLIGSDITLVTADDPINLVYNATKVANEINVKIISTGYILDKIRLSYLTNSSQKSEISWKRGPNFIAPSYGPSNVELAGVASSLMILALCDRINNENIPFTSTWSNINFPRN